MADAVALQPLIDAWHEVPGPAPRNSARYKVRRGQSWVALSAVGLWLLGLAQGIVDSEPAIRVLGAACAAVLLFAIARVPREPWLLLVTLTASAAVTVFLTCGMAGPGQSPIAAAWFDTAALGAGLGLITLRRAVVGVLAVTGCAAVCWFAQIPDLPGGWHSALAWSVATLGLGMGAALVAAIVRRGAIRLDAMAGSAQSASSYEDVAEIARDDFFRTSRVLHDTIINTLSAIGRGVPESRRPELLARCRQDLRLMDEAVATSAEADAVDPVATARDRAAALGLDLAVEGTPTALVGVAPDVLQATGSAVGEALLNISKHAGVDSARLVVGRTDARHVSVQVIDSGRGWDGPAPPDGGISRSIVERCRRQGIRAEVRSAAGTGTAVDLLIPRPVTQRDSGAMVFRSETRLIAAAGCGALLLEVAVRWLLSLGVIPGAPAAGLSLAALALPLTGAFLAGRNRVRTPHAAAMLVALSGVPVVVFLPTAATGPLAWGWWGSIAGIAIFMGLLMLNASAWWVGVAYVAQMAGRWLAQEEDQSALMVPALVTMAIGAGAIVLIRRKLFTLVAEYDELARSRERRRRRALAATASRLEGREQLHQAIAAARLPLVRLVAGTVTGQEPEVREEASQLAAYLRNVARVQPDLGMLAGALLRLLADGRERGATITLTIDPNLDVPDIRTCTALTGFLDRTAAALVPDGAVSISLIGRARGGVLARVSRTAMDLSEQQAAALLAAGITVDGSGVETDHWVELTWRKADPPPPDPVQPPGDAVTRFG